MFIHPLIVPERIQDGKEGFSSTHPPRWQELQCMCNEAWPLCPGNVWTVGCELQDPQLWAVKVMEQYMLSSAQVRQATATQIVKPGSEFLLLYLRDQRSVPSSHSHHRSQIFNALAAWKGLTRVNHAVTEAGAAGWGRLCPWHGFRRQAPALVKARVHLRFGPHRQEGAVG